MPKRKHVNKVHVAPRTDANQGVREHIERVKKRNEYIAKKIAEFKAKQMLEAQEQAAKMGSVTPKPVDGLATEDPANA